MLALTRLRDNAGHSLTWREKCGKGRANKFSALERKAIAQSANSDLLLLDRFRGWKILRLISVIVLSSHHRVLGNLIEIVIEKRESRVVDVV